MLEKKTKCRWMECAGLLGSALFLCLNALVVHQVWFGLIAAAVWVISVGTYLSRLPLGVSPVERWFWGWGSVGAGAVVLLVLGYWLFGLSPGVSCVALLVLNGLILGVGQGATEGAVKCRVNWREEPWALAGLIALADLVLCILLLLARTPESLISPWNILGGEVFILFGVATWLLMHRATISSSLWQALAILHMGVGVSVAAIVFDIGFGFDPFVHRAAETALAALGHIEPQQLLYSGQYTLVVALHQLLGVSVRVVDIWLVPALGALGLAVGIPLGLERGWGLERTEARTWMWVLLVIPFMLLTFTVPFSATYVLFMLILAWLPVFDRTQDRWLAGVLLAWSAASLLFHPLLMGPVCLGLGVRWLFRQTRFRRIGQLMGLLATALTVPLLFVLLSFQQGQQVFVRWPWVDVRPFLNLFRSPYTHPFPYIPWHLETLYDLRYLLPMLLVLLVALLCVLPSIRRLCRGGYAILAAGLLCTIWIVSCSFSFGGIISHEQSEYALRLLQAWYLLPLPVLAVWGAQTMRTRPRLRRGAVGVVAVLVTISWFFSYPQFNLKYPFFSPSVGVSDLHAVKRIEELAQGEPYLVLSNQMMSAAALQVLGFAHYYPYQGQQILWYAIPTGGPLYAYYMQLVQGSLSRDGLRPLVEETGVTRVYYVLQSYWPWEPGYLDARKRDVDRVDSVDDGRVLLLEYQF